MYKYPETLVLLQRCSRGRLRRWPNRCIASDNNACPLAVVKGGLDIDLDASRISYTHSKGEGLAAHHLSGFVNMIAAADGIGS